MICPFSGFFFCGSKAKRAKHSDAEIVGREAYHYYHYPCFTTKPDKQKTSTCPKLETTKNATHFSTNRQTWSDKESDVIDFLRCPKNIFKNQNLLEFPLFDSQNQNLEVQKITCLGQWHPLTNLRSDLKLFLILLVAPVTRFETELWLHILDTIHVDKLIYIYIYYNHRFWILSPSSRCFRYLRSVQKTWFRPVLQQKC